MVRARFDGFTQLPAKEQRFLDTEKKRAQHREDRVEAEGYALEEEGNAVGLGGQEADTGDEYERLHVAGPGVERQLGGDGRGCGVHDIGQFFVADPFLVRDGLDGGAHQYGTDRSTLEEDDTQHPGDEFGGSRSADKSRRHEFRERLGRAGSRPDPHEPAQQPQVQ